MRAEVRDAIISLQDDNGNIRPEDLVEIARSPNHILHPFFEWNDLEAAAQHRLDRARQLIREVRIEYTALRAEPIPVKAYVHDPYAGSRESRYVSVVEMRNDRDRVRLALLADLRKVKGALSNIISLAEFWAIETAELVGAHDRVHGFVETLENNPDTLLPPPSGGKRRRRKKKGELNDTKKLDP